MIGTSVGLDVFLTIKRRREKLLEYLEGRSRYPLQDSDAQTILLAISVGASLACLICRSLVSVTNGISIERRANIPDSKQLTVDLGQLTVDR